MAAYELPDLPYDYGALAPHISGEIMELHHSKHHAAYVKGSTPRLETARRGARWRFVRQHQQAREGSRLPSRRAHQPLGVLAEHVPEGGDRPDGALGSGDRRILRQLRQVPCPVLGERHTPSRARAGRCWFDDALGGRLNIVQLFDQQGNLPLAQIPILLLDMWEHAFYLQYQQRQGRLRHRMVERRQLGGCSSSIRRSNCPDRRADRASVINSLIAS